MHIIWRRKPQFLKLITTQQIQNQEKINLLKIVYLVLYSATFLAEIETPVVQTTLLQK
jgi:hypothetical protein